MKLLLMQILSYFTEINHIFDNISVLSKIKFELIQNTLFIDVEKIISYFAQQKTFSVSEGALLNTLQLLFCKIKLHADFW